MPDTRFDRARTVALALLLLFPLAVTAAEEADTSRDAAGRFAKLFLAGDDDAIDAMMTDQMRSAFSATQRQQIRAGLEQQQGASSLVGDAWQEDTYQGYERFRVPVTFGKGDSESTLDFRVVIGGDVKVAGFFIVPHLDRKAFDEPAPHREVEVEVGEGETALSGLLTLPDGEGPFPGVVLVHGSGPNDRDETVGANKPFRDLAWGLAGRGVAVLRYAKRSYARPQDLTKLGAALTVEDEVVRDAHAALDRLRRRPEIDPRRVFVLGHSLGGTLAPWIATSAAPRPAGVIVLAGATLPLPEKMLEQYRYIFSADGTVSDEEQAQIDQVAAEVRRLRAALAGETEAPEGDILGAPVGYYRDLERHDPPAEAAALELPVFVLQGKRDYQVTMEDFARWREKLAGRPGACLVAYEGLDHLFRHGEGPSTPADYQRPAPVALQVLDDLAAWILSGRCPGT